MMTEKNLILIKQKKQTKLSQCKICGSPAIYSYFGVISCQSCKIFFRRNAENQQKTFKCKFDDQCEININTRHVCPSCRLKKCFQQGMKVEKIRRSTTYKKKNQIQKFPTLNLLEKDNSLLDNNQWILLTNLINIYDQSKLFLISSKIKNEINKFKIINQSLVQDLLTSFYEIAGNYLCSNNDITHLSSDDRSILLHTAADNVTCLGGIFTLNHSQLLNDNIFWNYLENLYGKLTTDYHRWSAKFTEPDIIIFKLSLALFAFSTNSRTFHRNVRSEYINLKQILEIQNKYAELTWKYLLYKYGYYQAIKRFLHIIEWFLAVSLFMSYAHNAEAHVDNIESLIEQTELTLILDDVERVAQDNI